MENFQNLRIRRDRVTMYGSLLANLNLTHATRLRDASRGIKELTGQPRRRQRET